MEEKLDGVVLTPIICLFWFAAVFDPIGGLFMLRYVALVAVATCVLLSGLVWQVFSRKPSLRNMVIGYVSFVMPAYGFLIYAIRGGYASSLIDTSYAAAGGLLLLSLIYRTEALSRVGVRAMILSLRLLVPTTVAAIIAALIINSHL